VDGELVHESAGALVRRDGKTLLFKRTRFPLGWTIPAGHVEEGADPEAEMRREVREETGLVVATARRVWPDAPAIADACRRGADRHRWHLYDVEVEAGGVRLNEEGSEHAWQTDAQIGALGAAGLLVAPVRAIFLRLGVVAPRPARPRR
jgi:ADP-ribose pyrophosphatase YjhB (NUDIX family)